MCIIILQVGSKILCITSFSDDIVMIGTLDFYIHAICTKERYVDMSYIMCVCMIDLFGV